MNSKIAINQATDAVWKLWLISETAILQIRYEHP